MPSPTVTQSVDGGMDTAESATNRLIQFTSNVLPGALLLVAWSTIDNNPDNFTIQDDKSNAWFPIETQFDGISRGCSGAYAYANAGSVGAKPIVTLNKNGSSCGCGGSIHEIAGVDPTTALDMFPSVGANVNTGPAQVTLGSTATATTLVMAILAMEQVAYSVATPLTSYADLVGNTNTAIALQHKVQSRAVSAIASYTPGWTITAASHWNVVAFALRGVTPDGLLGQQCM